MADEDDARSQELSIRMGWSKTGMSLGVKSRTVDALERLFAALVDWPRASIEGKAAKQRTLDEVERRVIQAQGDVAVAKAKALPDAGDTYIEILRAEEAKRLRNRAGVAIEAVEEMRRLPPPGAVSHDDGNDGTTDEGNIDPDWMNSFIRYAEDASSEDLQKLWGRVLSGEIRRPGTFSRRTLRFMAELDRKTAEICEFASSRVISHLLLTNKEWDSGSNLKMAMELQHLGLIEGVGGTLKTNLILSDDGRCTFHGDLAVMFVDGPPGKRVGIQALQLTQLGTEVFALLPRPNERELFISIANDLPKDGLTKITVADVLSVVGDILTSTNPVVVWEAPSPP